jgi:thioredoxin:protein disulfide reductase
MWYYLKLLKLEAPSMAFKKMGRLTINLGLLLTILLELMKFGLATPATYAQSSSSIVQQIESQNTKPSRDIKPQEVIHWTPVGGFWDDAGKSVSVLFGLSTDQGFTIYKENLEFLPTDDWFVKDVLAPPTSMQLDPISGKNVEVYQRGEFKVTLSTSHASSMPAQLSMRLKYVGCTKVICLFPFTETLTFPITLDAKGPSIDTPKPASIQPPSQPSTAPEASGGSVEEQIARQVKSGKMSLATFLLFAFIGGLLTNLTPCVAPMIPITIRLLARQTAKPLVASSFYALGIVVTYTTLAVFASMSGALFGNFIAHPAVSITFGGIMAVLGFSMLGFGDLSKLQQLGGKLGSGSGGPFNAMMMGAGAGLVASPCTGPILAALLTYTIQRNNVIESTSILGTYSIGFALPYIFLGASAAKISQMRVNITLQIATKLIFAAIMFGLSLYFLRLPLYGTFMAIRPFWPHIGIIGSIAGFALMAQLIAKPELAQNKLRLIAPTIFVGYGLFFGIQHLTRQSGGHDSLVWYKTEEEAVSQSKERNKPILVDSWAEWCEACKKMDVTTFQDQRILDLLKDHYVLYKMDLTEPNDFNIALQEKYELPGLPTLTLLPSGGDIQKRKALNGYVTADTLVQELKAFNDHQKGSN